MPMRCQRSYSRGFSLLEVMFAVGLLAILATVGFFFINPAELFRQFRDARRVVELQALASALDLYLQETSPLTSPFTNLGFLCFRAQGIAGSAQIAYSAFGVSDCAENIVEGVDVNTTSGTMTFSTSNHCYTSPSASFLGYVNGFGWIPVDFTSIPSGSPLEKLPRDPVNTVATLSDPAFTDNVYRYACQNDVGTSGKPQYVYELNARFESEKYRTVQDKDGNDGGDEECLYEVGRSLRLMGDAAAACDTGGTDDY